MANRVSQEVVEALIAGPASARVSQVVVEVLYAVGATSSVGTIEGVTYPANVGTVMGLAQASVGSVEGLA